MYVLDLTYKMWVNSNGRYFYTEDEHMAKKKEIEERKQRHKDRGRHADSHKKKPY